MTMPITDSTSLTTVTRRSLAARSVRWVFALILALVLVFVIILVALFSFEQSTLRPLAERAVTQITGRAFSIEGGLDARVGRIVTVRADRIRLANADWGSSDDMLFLEGTEISIDLLPLLSGVLAIDNLIVSSGKLLSEQDALGRSNWSMGESDDQSSTREADLDEYPLLLAHSDLSNIDKIASKRSSARAMLSRDNILPR